MRELGARRRKREREREREREGEKARERGRESGRAKVCSAWVWFFDSARKASLKEKRREAASGVIFPYFSPSAASFGSSVVERMTNG